MLHRIKHATRNNKTIVGNIFAPRDTPDMRAFPPTHHPSLYHTSDMSARSMALWRLQEHLSRTFSYLGTMGESLTATRDISINREDKNKISEIFWNIMAIKICLSIIAALLGLILVFSFYVFYE